MKTSEQFNEIAAAMAKAQGAFVPAVKDANNPAFKSKYADLAAVWAACRKPLSENGITVWQDVTNEGNGVAVVTRLTHTSGQWVEFGPLVVPAQKPDAHGLGSAATYGKRYTLCAAIGVVADDEDDDGNGAAPGKGDHSQNGHAPKAEKREDRKPEAAAQPPAPTTEPVIPTDGVYTPLQLKHVEKDKDGNPIVFGILTAELGDWMLETKDRDVARALVDAKKAGRKVVIEWSTANGHRVIDQISAPPATGAAA